MTYTFLRETLLDIESSGHVPGDIIFIGSQTSGHSCTWDEFCELADFEYEGCICQEVASDLIIVFSDKSTMWREEHGGYESWKYSVPFTMPTVTKPITRLSITDGEDGWKTLEELNEENDGD